MSICVFHHFILNYFICYIEFYKFFIILENSKIVNWVSTLIATSHNHFNFFRLVGNSLWQFLPYVNNTTFKTFSLMCREGTYVVVVAFALHSLNNFDGGSFVHWTTEKYLKLWKTCLKNDFFFIYSVVWNDSTIFESYQRYFSMYKGLMNVYFMILM